MPIYNNPAIGQAFAGIADMFKPPSGSDAAGWAVANAKNAEAKRLQSLYDYANDPAYDRTLAERQAIAAGVYTPNQSFYAVDQGNATTMRGQDIGSADARYGVDVGARTSVANNTADNVIAARGQDIGASTSIANNTADNARALATNTADNERALAGNRLTGLAGLYGPLGEGQVRPALPAEIAGQFGAPGALPAEAGNAKPLTDTEVLGAAMRGMGAPAVEQMARDKYAPTETQVLGTERQGLRASGQLTDQDILDTITGKETPVQIIGPDGKPAYSTPGEAARTGAQPYVNAASRSTKVENWTSQDGKDGGIARFDETLGQYVDTTTGQPLPPKSRTYTGQLVGGSEQTGFGKTTEAENRTAYAAAMSEKPVDRLIKAFDTGQLPTTQDYVVFNAMAKLPAAAAPALVGQMTESGQAFYQDLRTALPFQLMVQSGAAVTEDEYNRKMLEITPVPGESPSVTAAKRENFQTYLKAVRGVSGAAYDKVHSRGGLDVPEAPGAQEIPPGTVQDGYVFKGGNPAEAANWEPAG